MAVATSSTKKLTYEDYLLLPDDGRRYEIIDGELYVTPAPGRKHQYIIGNLYLIFGPYVRRHRRGELYFAPFDVVMSRHDVVQPDLLYLTKERAAEMMNDRNLQGSPNFAVEVLSTSTKKKDEIVKLRRYEAFGVDEYWIVDPKKERVRVYLRRNDRLELATEAANEVGATLTSSFFPGLTVDVSEIFLEP